MTRNKVELNYKKMLLSLFLFISIFCFTIVFILEHVYFGTYQHPGEATVLLSVYIALIYTYSVGMIRRLFLRIFRCGVKFTLQPVLIDAVVDEKHLSRAERANYYREYCDRRFLIDPEAAERIKSIEERLRELGQERIELQGRCNLTDREIWLKRRLIVGEEATLLEELCRNYDICTGVPSDELIQNGCKDSL